jgi:8-oxo-dGTP diphosphatase
MEVALVSCLSLDSGEYVGVPHDSLVFRPSVYGVIINDEEILLVPTRNGYILPGGAVEKREGLEDALRREVREETNLDCGVAELIAATEDYYISVYDKKAYHSIILVYKCTVEEGGNSTTKFNEYEQKHRSNAEWVPLRDVEKTKSIYPKLIYELLNKPVG